MKNKVLSLCGEWNCNITNGSDINYNMNGTVPGCVHTDLQKAGILGDLFWRDNADSCQWIENCNATYTKTFVIEEIPENPFVVFEGLDVYCSIFLNGKKIGETDDMFIPWEFSVDGILCKGENVLEVRFRSPVKEVEGLPERGAAFTKERLHTRRVQCTYGWDWVARFVTMGIWKPVYLESRTKDNFENVYIYTDNINPYTAQIGIKAEFSDISGDSWAEFSILDPNGKEVYKRKRKIIATEKGSEETVISFLADITEPMLWYPLGYGKQPLYTLKITVDENEVNTTQFGIRTVTILETEDKQGSEESKLAKELKQYEQLIEWDRNEVSSSFILLVNGVRIFCTGANWVPAEPFPSDETDEKLISLVKTAAEGGYNMLRVWGGGIFEHDSFYSACDKYGILVTQDFLMACGDYPEDNEDFIAKLRLETKAAALQLRNHPSLVWWSGDNENAVNGDENKENYNGRRAANEGIAPILAKLDPHRRFLPSSPYGGEPYASAVRGTTHNTQFLGIFFKWVREACEKENGFEDYRKVFDTYLSRFCAEQPALGMPYISTLRKFLTEEDIFGEDTALSEYHTKNNPGLGAVTLYGYVERLAKGIFGDYKDGFDRVYKMQLLHCEWVRITMELFRRNAWYASGIIYWMFNDCWPAANSWSQIDYYGNAKPAFHVFRRCAQPIIGSMEEKDGQIRVYLSHRGKEQASGIGRLYQYNIVTGEEETIIQVSFSSLCNESRLMCEIPKEILSDNGEWILILDTDSSAGKDRAFYLPTAYYRMKFKYPTETETLYSVIETEKDYTFTAKETVPFLLHDTGSYLRGSGGFLKKNETITLIK